MFCIIMLRGSYDPTSEKCVTEEESKCLGCIRRIILHVEWQLASWI